MKRTTNYLIEMEIKDGGLTAEHCNNYNCALAYCEKMESIYKDRGIKTQISKDNKVIYLHNFL